LDEDDMSQNKRLADEALHAIAAEQDALVKRGPRSSEALAEEAMRRAWAPSRRARLVPYFAMGGVAAAVAFAVAFVVARPGRNDLRFEVAGRAGEAGASVTAQAGVPLPLRFSDGSAVVFQPGARARVARLTETGAELLLDRGRLVADVRHTGQARWSVAAGPFKVRVTGTRFGADWSPMSGKLAVEMFEGAVVVEGPSLGHGLALRAGETLEVGVASPPVVTRVKPARPAPGPGAEPVASTRPAPSTTGTPAPLAAATPDLAPTAVEAPAPTAPRPHPTWSELAANRRYREALAAAERHGFARLCRELDADGLLALGDAARYASSPGRARQAFAALVRRFSHDQRSQDALFALGRLEFEAGAPAAAARWFERYLAAAKNPPLGEEAAGRLVEIYDQAGDREAAVRAARMYLERHPDGLRAGLARRILAAQAPGEVRP
jgi:ferric-dicitrate binding protein FerR (iron transport regulator)/TolA-binding protein